MFPIYTYEQHTGFHDPVPSRTPRRPANRMDVERHRQEHKRMNYMFFDAESQLSVIQAQRLQKARIAEQIRLARGERQSAVAQAAHSVRGFIGSMFIAAGERIRPEPIALPELDVDPVDGVRHA